MVERAVVGACDHEPVTHIPYPEVSHHVVGIIVVIWHGLALFLAVGCVDLEVESDL